MRSNLLSIQPKSWVEQQKKQNEKVGKSDAKECGVSGERYVSV